MKNNPTTKDPFAEMTQNAFSSNQLNPSNIFGSDFDELSHKFDNVNQRPMIVANKQAEINNFTNLNMQSINQRQIMQFPTFREMTFDFFRPVVKTEVIVENDGQVIIPLKNKKDQVNKSKRNKVLIIKKNSNNKDNKEGNPQVKLAQDQLARKVKARVKRSEDDDDKDDDVMDLVPIKSLLKPVNKKVNKNTSIITTSKKSKKTKSKVGNKGTKKPKVVMTMVKQNNKQFTGKKKDKEGMDKMFDQLKSQSKVGQVKHRMDDFFKNLH